MFRQLRAGLLCAVAVATFAGCNSSSTPSLGLAPQRLYVTDNSATLWIYTLPVTATSTPVVTLTPGFAPQTMAFDSSGRLFIEDGLTSIKAYGQPITSSSTALFTLTATNRMRNIAFDPAGRLFAMENISPTCCVEMFNLSGTSTGSFMLSNLGKGGSPWGGAFDAGGDLFLADSSGQTEYGAPITSSSTPLHNFGSNSFNFGIAVDAAGNVYVANGIARGKLDVYNPPYTDSSTPAFSMQIATATNAIEYLAFDRAGNLYAAVSGDAAVYVFAPPFGASSTAAVKLPVTGAYGVAIGP